MFQTSRSDGPHLLTKLNQYGKPRQNGRHFPDDIFKCFFLNENVSIAIKISLQFVPKGPINNIPALVQIMAWRRPGDKPLSEAMIVYRCIYASPGLNELKTSSINTLFKMFLTLSCFYLSVCALFLQITTMTETRPTDGKKQTDVMKNK